MKSQRNRRNRLYYCAALLIVAIPLAGFVGYDYMTPGYLVSNSFNRTYTLAGDEAHSLSIEVTALNGLKQPMSGVAVRASANMGSVSSCTTSNGSCFIAYSPPRVAYNETATISISSGNARRYINITITPDRPTQLIIYGNATNQSVYTSSSVEYTVKAIDRFGNPAPNGTIVNFSYSGTGYLSATSCITADGLCNVTFTAPSKPETAILYASSGGISSQSSLNVLSRLIDTTLFTFSGSTASSTFCLNNQPYISVSKYLMDGENITWSIDQPLSISSAFVLDNQSAYSRFVGMVHNATDSAISEMSFYDQCELLQNGTWISSSSSPASSSYCSAGPPPNVDTANPYLAIGEDIQELNPIAYATSATYEGNMSFIAPSSGQYIFVMLASGMNPSYVSQGSDEPVTMEMPFNICYSASYVYNTTVHGGPQ